MSTADEPAAGVLAVHGPVVVVVAVGGALGSLARYGVNLALPHGGGFPVSTLLENVVGCVLLGALLVVVTELRRPHRLARPFLGTGVLGGFTTFSTYAVDAVTRDSAVVAALYLVGTLVLALAASWSGVWLARWLGPARFGTAR